eukprot:2285435-Alexandrium_andersonii.AAC.1
MGHRQLHLVGALRLGNHQGLLGDLMACAVLRLSAHERRGEREDHAGWQARLQVLHCMLEVWLGRPLNRASKSAGPPGQRCTLAPAGVEVLA